MDKQALQAPVKRVVGRLEATDGTLHEPSDTLSSFTLKGLGELLKTAITQIDVVLLGEHKLKGQTIKAHIGVYDETLDEYVYTQKGVFNILEAEYSKDEDTTKLTGYDNMVEFMKPYQPVSDFPTTLAPFLQALAAGVGVPLNTETVYNGNLPIPEDYWATIPEATYRDVLKEICEVTVSNARINPQGELELIPITHDSGETLTYDNLIDYKLEDGWGKVNSLVLSRQPQNDDVFVQDEETINAPTNRNILDLNKFNVGYTEGGA